MSSLFDYIAVKDNRTEWLIAGGVVIVFSFFRLVTWSMGLPPLDLVALAGLIFAYGITRTVTQPVLLLILITTGSLLGNLILIVEDGLIPFSLFQIFYIFGLLVFIMRWFMTGFEPIRKTGFELEIGLFFSLIFLSIIWTPDAEKAFLHALRVLVLSGLLFLFVNWIKKPQEIVWVIYSMIAVGAVIGAIAIIETINNPIAIVQDMYTEGARLAGRARIGQVDPNVFGSLFFLPLAYLATLTFSGISYWKRGVSALFFLVLFAAVLVTFSRSSWVSVLVMLIFLAVFYRQYNLFLFGAAAGIILVIAVPELQYLLQNILNRFMDLFSGEVDASNFIRIMLLDGSLRIFFDSWLLGAGWRGFPEAFLSYYNLQETLGVYEPHNVIYLVYSELGLIGLIIFTFIVYKIFAMAWSNIRMSTTLAHKNIAVALFAAFLAYAVFYQFLGSGFLDNQLWITTGLIIAFNYYLRNQSDPDEAMSEGREKPAEG